MKRKEKESLKIDVKWVYTNIYVHVDNEKNVHLKRNVIVHMKFVNELKM